MKKEKSLMSLEHILCCGIKDWDILERKGIQSLQGKGMAEGMSNCNSDFDFCERYLYGKKN